MRKLVRNSLTLATIAAASAAHAQSSVTLYGIVESDLMYTSNSGGAPAYQLVSGMLSGSRWGLKGSEDLGGGLRAVFTLENGFSIVNGKFGQSGREFGRTAAFGLAKTGVGTFTMGRQYLPSNDYLANLTLGSLGVGAQARHPYDNDNLGASVHSDNSVKFQSANFGGFEYSGLFGFSNSAGHFSDGRVYDLSVSYKYAGLAFAADYTQINNAGSPNDASGAISTTEAGFYAGRQRTFGAGVNYGFGNALVGFVYSQTQLHNASAIASGFAGTSSNIPLSGSVRFANYEVNGRYQFRPDLIVLGGYTFTDARLRGASPKYHQGTIEVDYILSKRTDVYTVTTYQRVTNAGQSGITANVIGAGSSSSASQLVTLVGLRHRF